MSTRDVWRAVESGARPSSVLLAGAVLLGAASVLPIFEGRDDAGAIDRRLASWWLWAASLFAVGLGLALAAQREFLHRYAFVPAGFYLAQAAALAAVLAGSVVAAFFYMVLSLPKLVALLVLPIVAREVLDRRTRQAIAGAAALGIVKSGLHAFWPQVPDGLVGPGLAVNLLLAWALARTARAIRREETFWATRVAEDFVSDLGRFNNPLHAALPPPPGAPPAERARREEAG